MGRGFSFRLLYRVVFFCLCLIFACFYHGGGSEYDRREDKTEPNKLKDEFKGKPLNVDVSLEQDKYDANLTGNGKNVDGDDTKNETDLSKMARKGEFRKCENIRNSFQKE
jgi:hypothetical protein